MVLSPLRFVSFGSVKKCCCWDSFLDSDHNCVPANKVESLFHQALKEIEIEWTEVEEDTPVWRQCPTTSRRQLNLSDLDYTIDLSSNPNFSSLWNVLKTNYDCLDLSSDLESLAAVVCLEEPPPAVVSKCCPEDQILLLDQQEQLVTCAPTQDKEQVMDETSLQGTGYDLVFRNNSHYCQELFLKSTNTSHLLLNNRLLYIDDICIDVCIDNAVTAEGEVVEIVMECYDGVLQDQLKGEQLTCNEKYGRTFRLANTVSATVSAVFLTITAIVYSFLPKLNNLHGKIILSNVLSITGFTVYILFIYNADYIFSDAICTFLGYFGYFFTMSMFSWMTIMSFDLFWTFQQAVVPCRDSMSQRFLSYSLVGWGFGLLVTLAVFLVDVVDNDSVIQSYKPNIGGENCFLQNSSHGIFIHLPIFVLMVVNSIFFLVTIWVLYRYTVVNIFYRSVFQDKD